MDLSKICIKPKKRSSWQAIDLGFKLTLQWFKPLFILYSLPFYLFAITIGLILSEHLGWALLLIWWMKPIFERAPLQYASQALFGEQPSIREILKIWTKINRLNWVPSITWRRFSYSRSFDLPVTVLERLTGSQRTERINILHNKGSGEALALSILCFTGSFSLLFAFFSLINLLIPEPIVSILSSLYWSEFDYFEISYAMYFVAVLIIPVIELFFICSGFLLYINRRIHIEAWDIEINFRNMLNKEKYQNIRTLNIAPLMIGLLLTFNPFTPNAVQAQQKSDSINPSSDTYTGYLSKDSSKDKIIEIFETDDFSQKNEVTKWRLKDHTPNNSDDDMTFLENIITTISTWLEVLFQNSPTLAEDKSSIEKFFDNLSTIVKALLILTIIAAIITVIYRYKQNLFYLINGRKNKQNTVQPVKTLFGLKVTEESLPNNVPEEVLHLYQLKKQRSAISLLYRASLTKLMTEKHIKFSESDTEGECVALVKSANDKILSSYINDVTQLWVNLAYGHVLPTENEVKALCERWLGVFHREP